MLLLSILLSGCNLVEDLPHYDLFGEVRIPKAASQFTFGPEGKAIDDMRALGPVYIGAFPSVQTGLFPYPHPEMGPVLSEGQEGDTYPYGGTSIGRFDWACYQPLVCKTVTGRYSSYEDIIDFHNNVLEEPILTAEGHVVSSAEEFQERCYELMYATGDHEFAFLDEVDFVDDGDEYVAEVELLHTYFREGMSIWGWIDMPSSSFNFSTCNPSEGAMTSYYDQRYERGTNYPELLNAPSKRIDYGDWVSEGVIVTDPTQDFVLEIGFPYVDD